jgi:hypothetical protein
MGNAISIGAQTMAMTTVAAGQSALNRESDEVDAVAYPAFVLPIIDRTYASRIRMDGFFSC